MISDLQREITAVLVEIRSLSPDVRLGQLFDLLGFLGEVHVNRGLASIDDDELHTVMYRHRAELLARSQNTLFQATPSADAPTAVEALQP